MKRRQQRRRRHAQIHLPPLDAAYALTLANIFERASAAIWRAHGDCMAELLQLREAARRAPRPEPQLGLEHAADGFDDEDDPF